MKRKLLCVCMTLMMLCVGINVKAEIAHGTCGENLTWVLSDDGTLSISGSGAMATWYSPSSTPWYSYISEIKKVVIGSSVTVIGNIAFYECSTLESVRISNSVTSIGEYAFHGCKGLKSVEIPNSVTDIGEGVFSGCTGLTSVKIGNSLTSIGSSAFWNCSGLTSLEIGNSVTSIGSSAFWNCSGLTSLEIPNSVTSIASRAFYGCSRLTSVSIPNSIIYIEYDVFYGCPRINEVNISCKDEEDFVNYLQRTDIYNTFHSLFAGTPRAHNIIINGEIQNSIIIPDSMTHIGNYAFCECKSLKSIHIPNSLKYIGRGAFLDCSSLSSLTIPDSVTRIEGYTFSYCTSLASVVIPNSVTYIGDGAFLDCMGLTSVTIPNSITYEAFGAFDGCSKISEVNVACKDEDDFVNYVQRTDISRIFHSPLHTVSRTKNIIINGEKRDSVTIPDFVTAIGDNAFYYCTGFKSLKVESKEPPQCNSSSFSSIYSATLYVPEGSVDAYRATKWWNRFQTIKTFTPSPLKRTDINGDGITNVGDLTMTVEGVMASSTDVKYDVNGDGVVNVGDLTEIVTVIMDSSSKRYKVVEMTDDEVHD